MLLNKYMMVFVGIMCSISLLSSKVQAAPKSIINQNQSTTSDEFGCKMFDVNIDFLMTNFNIQTQEGISHLENRAQELIDSLRQQVPASIELTHIYKHLRKEFKHIFLQSAPAGLSYVNSHISPEILGIGGTSIWESGCEFPTDKHLKELFEQKPYLKDLVEYVREFQSLEDRAKDTSNASLKVDKVDAKIIPLRVPYISQKNYVDILDNSFSISV